MKMSPPVRPFVYCYPIMGESHDPVDTDFVEEEVDPKMAMLGEPIVGIERVVYDDATGSGAIPARPLSSPKSMSAAERAVHDLTHLPYHPGCEVCTSCRRPNSHHRTVAEAERQVPLIVGDYCFPKHTEDSDPLTLLVMRVYPYKLFMVCCVPSKGRNQMVIERIVRFIKDCGLTHFTYRSDREPAILAMMDEACALSGRKGEKDEAATDSEAISHYQFVDAGHADGAVLGQEEVEVDDAPHVPSSRTVESTHTAAPELTHPGESQSNGYAERSVGVFEDHFRTLKHSLELRIQRRLPVTHPVTSWLVEHTAWILNKFHLSKDGRTAYGRLHGREGQERICEFGERIMWFVPKKLRAKLDQRWRYGIFLGRSLSSDQNYIGLSTGEVVCARAIVRVVPSLRWSSEMISRITVSPLDFKIGALDKIEEQHDPHAHPEPEIDPPEADESLQRRRLQISDADVVKHGYTDSCHRCRLLQQGRATAA